MNIKIVICFIIICFLPVSSLGAIDPDATDKILVAKYSGFIKSNESINFENFIVKVVDMNTTTASMMVYRDKVLIETKKFEVNEFKKYGDVVITVLGIKEDYLWIAFSKMEDKDIWAPLARTTLKWGDTYSFENYSIGIEAIGKDSVNLTISNKNTVNTDVFTKNDFKNYDNIRILVREINRTGLIDIEFFKFNVPAVKAELITDKDEYFPDENISILINITTDEPLNIAGVSIDSKNSIIFQPSVLTATGINNTASFRSQINKLPPNSTITINGIIEVRDYYNNPYLISVNKKISIAPYIYIIKRVPEETDDEKIPVELFIYNAGSKKTSVYIYDTVDETNANQMDWNIELEPKKSTNISYYISPLKPGIYRLTTATAQWDNEKSISKEVKTTVHMPYIRMVKTASNNEVLTDVELEIKNIGDRPAFVNVNDIIPNGFPVNNGSPTWSGFVDAGMSANFRYSFKGTAIVLPAANATYRDIRGVVRQAQSNTATNYKKSGPDKVDTTTNKAGHYEIMIFMVSSFIVISGIISSIALIAYLITKTRTRLK